MARAMALQAIGLGFESPYLHRYGFDRSDSARADSAESDSEGRYARVVSRSARTRRGPATETEMMTALSGEPLNAL